MDAGAAVDAKSRQGNTPLLMASAQGEFEMVRLLIEHRACLDDKLLDMTPEQLARLNGHVAVADLLEMERRRL